ncbi:MAG TPA: molybdenum cofactor guanylyltransferase [Candidatus Binataceae bacterium]|nr:molybdenum cofactor guanylyltransferase [Candidatus Binataceae bacterium]
MPDQPEYSAIILAGGRSSRMARPKCDLQFGAGAMLDYIVAAMTAAFDDLVVAVAESRQYAWENVGARVIVDRVPHRGPVSALEQSLREIEFDRAFVCSCDVPFVSGGLARKLCDLLGAHDALIPQVDGRLQTLHAVYRKTCARVLAAMCANKENRLHDIVNFANVRIVPEEEMRALDPELLGFFNVNTPEDYQRALKLMRQGNKM